MRFFLPLFLFFFIFSSPVISEQKIVFVDMDRLVSVSKSGASIFKQLNVINNKNLNSLKEEKKKLQQKEKKLIAQKNIISEADFQNKIEQFKIEINEYNKNKDKTIKNFNNLKINSTNKILKLINPILAKYSEDNSISIILQKKDLVIGKKELDITDEIIKIVNIQVKKFEIN